MIKLLGLETIVLILLFAMVAIAALRSIAIGVIAGFKPHHKLRKNHPVYIWHSVERLVVSAIMLFLVVSNHDLLSDMLPADLRIVNKESTIYKILSCLLGVPYAAQIATLLTLLIIIGSVMGCKNKAAISLSARILLIQLIMAVAIYEVELLLFCLVGYLILHCWEWLMEEGLDYE